MNQTKYLFSTVALFSTWKYSLIVFLFHPMHHMKTFITHLQKPLENLIYVDPDFSGQLNLQKSLLIYIIIQFFKFTSCWLDFVVFVLFLVVVMVGLVLFWLVVVLVFYFFIFNKYQLGAYVGIERE